MMSRTMTDMALERQQGRYVGNFRIGGPGSAGLAGQERRRRALFLLHSHLKHAMALLWPSDLPSTGRRRPDMLPRLQNGGVLEPMPVNLSIKNAPDKIVERLRRRAERHHRSLQGELLAIVEEAVRTEGELSPRELLAEVRRLGVRTSDDATAIIRADRDRR